MYVTLHFLTSNGWMHRDLDNAQTQLSTQEGELEQARGRSQEAETKYNQLQALAEKHAQYGDSAAAAAAEHSEKFQVLALP